MAIVSASVELLRVTRMNGGHAVRDQRSIYPPCEARWVDEYFSMPAQAGTVVSRTWSFPGCTAAMDTLWERSAGQTCFFGRYLTPRFKSTRTNAIVSVVKVIDGNAGDPMTEEY